MKQHRHAWTIKEVALVVRDREIGKSASQTGKLLGRTAAAIANLRSLYNVYKNQGRADAITPGMKDMFDFVIKAEADPARLKDLAVGDVYLPEPEIDVIEDEVDQKVQEDDTDEGLAKVDEAFTKFQHAVVDFIDTESKRRAKEEVKNLESVYEEKMKKVEDELSRLEQIVDSAKDSSLIGLLQKKLRG